MGKRRRRSSYDFDLISLECKKIIVKLLENGSSGHIGGSLSCLDILIVIYYLIVIDKYKIHFIMSKAHCECGLYSVLIYYNLIDCKYSQFKIFNSPLQGHPNKKRLPILEYSGGSLGQGISYGIGKAISLKNSSLEKVVVLAGDGEIQEGQFWEAIQSCIRYNLHNFILVVDMNKYQLESETFLTANSTVMKKMLSSVGFNVIEINGHKYHEIFNALLTESDKPTIILANTIKGNGISFMENKNEYHGRELTKEEIRKTLNELNNKMRGTFYE